jgi:CTP synthase
MVKCDPYINVDAGSMSPYQHGEVYVTDDGAQTDLDLGNYARFTKGRLGRENSITTGQVYEAVIRKEREGQYQGRCVQVIPHITDEIKNRIVSVIIEDNETDVVIIEIGGTVGDIESVPFLEAARQVIHEYGRKDAISVHLTLIPEVSGGELKTKPTQHSVKSMQEMGIQPDILICRSPVMLDKETCQKIALFTNVDPDAVFTSPNIDTTIYSSPIVFYNQKLDQVVLKKMGVESRHADMRRWNSVMERFTARKGKVRIGIVGMYIELHDAYKSIYEALFHASLECAVEVDLVKIDSSALEKPEGVENVLGSKAPYGGVDGILIPGGHEQRCINGFIKAAAWARENRIPYLGIGLGMYIMVIEWSRNVLNWKDADSTEFNQNTKYPVISNGGSMKLGVSEITIEDSTHIFSAYGEKQIFERHRHYNEFSNQYRDEIAASGLKLAGFSSSGTSVECVEWSPAEHPWGVGIQFYPEYKSKPMAATPLFRDFVAAVKKNKL